MDIQCIAQLSLKSMTAIYSGSQHCAGSLLDPLALSRDDGRVGALTRLPRLGRRPMLARVLHCVRDLADLAFGAVRRRLATALRPAATSSLVLGTATDLLRGEPELVAENALLRQQLIVLARSTKRQLLTGHFSGHSVSA